MCRIEPVLDGVKALGQVLSEVRINPLCASPSDTRTLDQIVIATSLPICAWNSSFFLYWPVFLLDMRLAAADFELPCGLATALKSKSMCEASLSAVANGLPPVPASDGEFLMDGRPVTGFQQQPDAGREAAIAVLLKPDHLIVQRIGAHRYLAPDRPAIFIHCDKQL